MAICAQEEPQSRKLHEDAEHKMEVQLSPGGLWGGFFERLIGITKKSLSKVIGRSLLTYQALEETLLDVETYMNNRPLLYQEEEFEQPVLTPNTLLRGKPTPILEEDLEKIAENGVTRRMRFLQRIKENLRKRFLKEYVHALEERQWHSTEVTTKIPDTGAVVWMKGEAKGKALWKLGRVVGTVTGKDGAVHGLKLRQGNGYVVECPLQLVCDLEIGGENPDFKLSPEAEVFTPRLGPSRRTKKIANEQIKDMVAQEVKDNALMSRFACSCEICDFSWTCEKSQKSQGRRFFAFTCDFSQLLVLLMI